MAMTSSETSDLNIAAGETSNHLEIKPKIKDVEDIGASNEGCGLERKECDEIMEHLKNNPGLVVKSLGLEGQIVLHVAMMTDEATKKLKSPASECINKGFSKARHDSEWYVAMDDFDCNALMSLLEANSYLVAQTGPEGMTVLHVAAEMGCLGLLNQVFGLFEEDEDHWQFEDKTCGVKVDLSDFFRAKYGPSEVEFQNIAWFTLPRESYTFVHPREFQSDGGSYGPEYFDGGHAPLPLDHKFFEISRRESSKKAFEGLEEKYQSYSKDHYIGRRSIEEMQFHTACKYTYTSEGVNYLKTIIDGFLEPETSEFESAKALKEVFQVHNEFGRTPFHTGGIGFIKILNIVPKGKAYKACVNVIDVRGWTILHYVAATQRPEQLKVLLEDERIDVNVRTIIGLDHDWIDENPGFFNENCSQCPCVKEVGMTALHLAILHNDAASVELLLKYPDTDVNALLYRRIVCGYERTWSRNYYEELQKRTYWTPLQLAAIMGQTNVVRTLLESSKLWNIYGDKKLQNKLQNNNELGKDFRDVSPLLLASASGNTDTLRLFLDNKKFDPLVKSGEGATALHYATNAVIPIAKEEKEFRYYKVGPFLYFTDFGDLERIPNCRYEEEPKVTELTPKSYLGRQACITMLLQGGVDIWEKDDYDGLADPGPQAPKEALVWWHEQMARETLEAKKSLNDAANAISVVAALVATASFVGPLQPPLGYGGDSIEGGIQDTYLSVRVFMVSNILSFYFAVASIMFAVVPSLPMPQEGIYAEWQRTRRSVGVAIFFLLLSVLGVLISFGTASNLVISEDYSWQHAGLSFYPTLIGGFICILGIILLFIRLLRLVFHRNATIIYLYTKFVKF